MTGKPLKAWAANGLLFIGALTLGALFSELAIRTTMKDGIVLFPRYHTGAQYGKYALRRLRSELTFWHTSVDGRWKFITNAQGFRDTEDYAYQKRPGLYRVLCLGDSHTQGFECPQDRTYAAVLERFLKREGLDAQVMNTGISGFSTAEELAFLESEGVKYEPDAVVVGLFANDFEDNIKSNLFGLDGDRLTAKSTTHAPGVRILDVLNAVPPLRWLGENSYFYSLAMNTVWESAKRALLSRAESRLMTEFAVPSESVSEYQHELMVRLFERMARVCRERGITLIILDIPTLDDCGFTSSIPVEMIEELRAQSDGLLLSDQVLGDYRGLVAIHVPHGHRHVSEFTHLMMGVHVGREILERRDREVNAGGGPG